jgi:hypothetical protein
MTRHSRFIDGVDFVDDDSDWIPTTPSQLLAKLRVRRKSHEEQRVAIARWLESNEPSRFLRICLEDDGFGDLLHDPGATVGQSAA